MRCAWGSLREPLPNSDRCGSETSSARRGWWRVSRRRRRKGQDNPSLAIPATATETQRRVIKIIRREAAEAKSLPPGVPTEDTLRHGVYHRVVPPRGIEHTAHVTVLRNVTRAPIDIQHAAGRITERQHAAARQYRTDHDKAGFERPLVANYTGGGGSGSGSPNYAGLLAANNAQLDARQRLRDARRTIPQRLLLRFEAIVIEEQPLREVGEADGRTGNDAPRIAAEWLRICCDQLADWYRIA